MYNIHARLYTFSVLRVSTSMMYMSFRVASFSSAPPNVRILPGARSVLKWRDLKVSGEENALDHTYNIIKKEGFGESNLATFDLCMENYIVM